jgi:hypothetical protein
MPDNNLTPIIYGIKTNKGYFISNKTKYDSWDNKTSLTSCFFNGKKPLPTFHESWVFVDEEINKVEVEESQPNINYRWELIDISMESEKIPLILKAIYDNEYGWQLEEGYEYLSSLYKLTFDKQPNIMVEIPFDFKIILEVDDIKEFQGFEYPVQKTQWTHDGLTNLTPDDVTYQILDKIMFPEIMLPLRPCKFTSEQMYKIVRQYIKQNINYEYATISSDYDFCFEVKKKIKLDNPYESKTEVTKTNGKSYHPPRYNTKYVKDRSISIFEMTYSPKNYSNHTPIPEMWGENIEDLKDRVDKYCQELIEAINKPLVDCPHCHGEGVILQEKIKL